MDYLSALLISMLITIAMIPLLVRMSLKYQIVDVPDSRKVHTAPIPRCGGIAISIGSCVSLINVHYDEAFIITYLAGVGVLIILGIFDDINGIDYRIKLAGQIISAAIVVGYGGVRILSIGYLLPEFFYFPKWASMLLTIVTIVGVTNAINLSDGLDGLAGGLCLMSFCCIGYLSYLTGKVTIALMAVSMAGSIFGFLRYNTFPASLFMGDTGSMFLGFSLVVLSIAITQGATPFSPFLPLLVIGFPIMDTVVVMVERILHGKSPFVADKNHFHHKLLKMGFYHSESVMIIYLIQGLLISAGIFFRFYEDGVLLSCFLMIFLLISVLVICTQTSKIRFERPNFLDRQLKSSLWKYKEQGVYIKMVFWPLEWGFPLLLLMAGLLPATISSILSILSAVLLMILLITWFFRKNLLRSMLSFTIYIFIPFMIYAGSKDHLPWFDNAYINLIYYFIFIGFTFCVIGTLKLTKRKKGFISTNMDFLIILIVFIFPFVSDTYRMETFMVGFASKTLMMFFAYEVLIGELRGQYERLAAGIGAAMVLVIVRGFTG